MPRRTRTYLVGKKENRQRRDRERELEQLAAVLRREWRWVPRPTGEARGGVTNSAKHYGTILADPPWDVPSQHGRLGAVRHYPLITIEDICALRVDRLAAENSHCWVWVTNAAWREQIAVMEAWGFSYRSCLTWIKPRLGLGRYLRNQTEHLLLGVRGKAPIRFRGQGSWLYAPVQAHSHKPEEAYAVIERCSPSPYLELLARRKRLGWDMWGDEVCCDVAL